MTPRDVISALTEPHDELLAVEIVIKLRQAGYVILPAAEAQAVRDRALEEVAELVEGGEEVFDPLDDYRSTVMRDWQDMDKLATAIRAMKEEKP